MINLDVLPAWNSFYKHVKSTFSTIEKNKSLDAYSYIVSNKMRMVTLLTSNYFLQREIDTTTPLTHMVDIF